VSNTQLVSLRDQLLQAGLRDEIAADQKSLADAEAARRKIESCDTYDKYEDALAIGDGKKPSHGHIMEVETITAGCSVKIRFIYQVLRAFPPQQVFAQTLLGFEVASADPDVVGINFVQPEDDRRAMADYHLQMQMLDYLHSIYPSVKISLHAGELAPGMVPPEGLKFHIREAIDLGHASRIGHGVDVIYEQNHSDVPVGMLEKPLLKEMADKHIMVEINLTSNDVILGIKGHDHPLTLYREAHVPVALSTDDEGVSRINLTHEYVRAAIEYGLGYLDLKEMARTSIEHSFLPGDSLWEKQDVFTRMKAACAGQKVGTLSPTAACQTLLKSSEKAAQQWELERRFAVFEASLP
jgi:adenosine deaminase